jgi:hypothetical protein
MTDAGMTEHALETTEATDASGKVYEFTQRAGLPRAYSDRVCGPSSLIYNIFLFAPSASGRVVQVTA